VKDVDVKKIVGEVAARHGVLIDENDPLMVALTANGLVLEALARELMAESRAVIEKLESASVGLPEEARAALAQAAERSAEAVRQGLASDIEGAGIKARAIVDSVYRARSRAGVWMWTAVGMLAACVVFAAGFITGRWGFR
jgi:hypothetical protein